VRLKLDANLPRSARDRLVAPGLDVDTVLDEALGGRGDRDVWLAAQAAGRVLVTQDLDFSDARRFEPGSHHELVLDRLPDAEHWRIGDHLVAWFSSVEARSWDRCFFVVTANKVRLLRPSAADDG